MWLTPAESATSDSALVGRRPGQVITGLYGGYGATGVKNVSTFEAWSGRHVSQTLLFPPSDTWANVTAPTWFTTPWLHAKVRWEYSLPLVLDKSGSLSECASGAYNQHWRALGQRLVALGKVDTIIRPGWEFNGSWYRWSAVSDPTAFVRCYRQVVSTMRSVPHEQFQFSWNPTAGDTKLAAEDAYPGDDVVDYVSLDVYDYSWSQYPYPVGSSAAQVRTLQQAAWRQLSEGRHGLQFWSRFAASHSRPLAVSEWGLASRSDGHGGGDDPTFIDGMAHFICDPGSKVAYHQYFNVVSWSGEDHVVTGQSAFPRAASTLRAQLGRGRCST